MLKAALTIKIITTGGIKTAAKVPIWNKYAIAVMSETIVVKPLLINICASELTLVNLIVNSPVLYFLKKEGGKWSNFIIVASWTPLSIL